MLDRRQLLSLAAAAALPLGARAQDPRPSKPIRILIPGPAGGLADEQRAVS